MAYGTTNYVAETADERFRRALSNIALSGVVTIVPVWRWPCRSPDRPKQRLAVVPHTHAADATDDGDPGPFPFLPDPAYPARPSM